MVAGSSGANVTKTSFMRRNRSVSSDDPGTRALTLSDQGSTNGAPGRSVSQRTNIVIRDRQVWDPGKGTMQILMVHQ